MISKNLKNFFERVINNPANKNAYLAFMYKENPDEYVIFCSTPEQKIDVERGFYDEEVGSIELEGWVGTLEEAEDAWKFWKEHGFKDYE